jgi:hypothetical protein
MEQRGDRAFVISVHYESDSVVRINLRWEGRHDITAFALDRLGEVVEYKNETPNSGWLTVDPNGLEICYGLYLFGPAKIGASLTTSPGETIPLKDSGRTELNIFSNFASFWTSMKICAQQKRLAGIARCVFEELVKRKGRRADPPPATGKGNFQVLQRGARTRVRTDRLIV